MSIEAMAMAGMDYKESAINLEQWDPRYPEKPPLYLLVESNELVNVDAKLMKAKIREWAKAVASSSKQEHITNENCKIIFSLLPFGSSEVEYCEIMSQLANFVSMTKETTK
ncbi:hypothetical protein VNO77_43940 [Canavalia gladiata]|uniref:Uncharacterized protein n=1 Tax=Canavalia gladiata TaxID=3824 RepID=A0AAN9JX56_CANGL